MTVRLAVAADAGGIAGIWNHYIRETMVTFTTIEKKPADVSGLIASRAAAGHGTFVCIEGRAVTGFASYSQFRSGPGYARTLEHTVLLAPGATGAGRGRALLGAVLEHARTGGGHSIYAGISSANSEGLAFHRALGFEMAAVLPQAGWKNDTWLDLHLMRRWL